MYKTLLHTPPGGYLKRYATKGKTLVHVLSLSPPLPSPVFGVMRRNRVNWVDDRTIARNDKILWLDKNGKKTDAQKQKRFVRCYSSNIFFVVGQLSSIVLSFLDK